MNINDRLIMALPVIAKVDNVIYTLHIWYKPDFVDNKSNTFYGYVNFDLKKAILYDSNLEWLAKMILYVKDYNSTIKFQNTFIL